MELLTLLAILSTKRRKLRSSTRLELFRVCLLASRAYAVAIDQEPPAAEPADRRALRRGELPLLIGHVFEAVRGSTYLRRGGRRTLAETIEDETDTDGTPHARSVDLLPWLLASVTRSVTINRGRSTLPKPMRRRFAELTGAAVHLAGPSLRLGSAIESRDILRESAKVAKLRGDAFVTSILNDKKPRGRGPEQSLQSDWGGIALLTGGRKRTDRSLRVDFERPVPTLHLRVNDKTVIDGRWDLAVDIDGHALSTPDVWNSVCWYADDESAYIELQATVDDVTMTRHILLDATDGLVLLSCSVRAREGNLVSCESKLSLADEIEALPHPRQTSIRLKGTGRVVPLGLPQMQSTESAGWLTAVDGELSLRQNAAERGLVLPMLLDLSGSRRRVGWRRLSVSEAGHQTDPGRADAFLYRLGATEKSDQWVYYQGVAKNVAARTVLGHHTHHEMVFGRFADREIDPLVHVASE